MASTGRPLRNSSSTSFGPCTRKRPRSSRYFFCWSERTCFSSALVLNGRVYLARSARQRWEPRKIGSTSLFVPIRTHHIAAVSAALLLLTGCDPTKRVPQGEYLLKRNTISVDGQAVDEAELESILKQ